MNTEITVPTSTHFDYREAFSRNIGWITHSEMERIRNSVIAIAGMGAVGGSYLLTLARLGASRFRIADMDSFALVNFNRQVGATLKTIDRKKVKVMTEMALEINPEIKIESYDNGLQADNIEDFFNGVDIYIDSLDFFAFDARIQALDHCEQKHIPVVSTAPLGMGAANVCFLPGKMTHDKYFGLKGRSRREQAVRMLVGMAPSLVHSDYLMDPSTLNINEGRGPSLPMGINLCAGIACSQALKILLGRGKVYPAPHGIHYDAYKNKLVHTWRPWGWQNPLQRYLIYQVLRSFECHNSD